GTCVGRSPRALASRGRSVRVIASHEASAACGGKPVEETAAAPGGPRVIRLKSLYGPLSPIATQATGRPILQRRELSRALGQQFDIVHFHNVSLVGGPGVLALGGPAVRLYTLHEHWLLCPTHRFWKNKSRLCHEKTCVSCQIRSGRPPQLWRFGAFLRDSLESVDLMLAPSRFTMERHRAEGISRPMRLLPHFVPEAAARPSVPERPVFLY